MSKDARSEFQPLGKTVPSRPLPPSLSGPQAAWTAGSFFPPPSQRQESFPFDSNSVTLPSYLFIGKKKIQVGGWVVEVMEDA